jgi:hypothetical protein
VSRRELIERVWPDVVVEEANLRVHLAGLRKMLGDGQDGARYIANVPGRASDELHRRTANAAVRASPPCAEDGLGA